MNLSNIVNMMKNDSKCRHGREINSDIVWGMVRPNPFRNAFENAFHAIPSNII